MTVRPELVDAALRRQGALKFGVALKHDSARFAHTGILCVQESAVRRLEAQPDWIPRATKKLVDL